MCVCVCARTCIESVCVCVCVRARALRVCVCVCMRTCIVRVCDFMHPSHSVSVVSESRLTLARNKGNSS